MYFSLQFFSHKQIKSLYYLIFLRIKNIVLPTKILFAYYTSSTYCGIFDVRTATCICVRHPFYNRIFYFHCPRETTQTSKSVEHESLSRSPLFRSLKKHKFQPKLSPSKAPPMLPSKLSYYQLKHYSPTTQQSQQPIQ